MSALLILIDLLAALMVLAGGFLCLVAAIGLVRLPDIFLRMHASTKAGTLGAGLMMAAVALQTLDIAIALRGLGVVIFLLLTAPVAAHLIGRAAYRLKEEQAPHTVRDDLATHPDAPGHAEPTQPPPGT